MIGSVFTACSTTKPVAIVKESKTLPSWYLNPPNNSSEYLYGVGEGSNLKAAKENALESMVSQLGVSISSNYESKINVHKHYNEFFTKETAFEIKSEVAKIRISNYEVMEREQVSYNQIMVLVRSNKAQFTKALVKEVNKNLKSIKTEQGALTSSDPLSRYRFYDKSIKELKDMFSTILVLSTLDITFDNQPYSYAVSTMTSKFQALKENMTFSVICDSDSQGFKKELQVGLMNEDKRIVEKNRNDKDHINIHVHTNTVYANAQGFDIARTVLFVEVKDNNAKVISGNKIDLIGHATQGKKVALNNAVKKLHALIEKEGVLSVLGIRSVS
jgi:hypothetical protein